MAEFRRKPLGSALTKATLHVGNKNVHLYFKGDDRGKSKIDYKSTPPGLVVVESVKMNNAPQGIRQVNLAAQKAGTTTLSAESGGKTLATLPISVEEKLSFPKKTTDAGMLARLLLSEAKNPWQAGYKEADSKKAMLWMHLVMHNRLNNKPELFLARGAKNLRDIVRGKGQFALRARSDPARSGSRRYGSRLARCRGGFGECSPSLTFAGGWLRARRVAGVRTSARGDGHAVAGRSV